MLKDRIIVKKDKWYIPSIIAYTDCFEYYINGEKVSEVVFQDFMNQYMLMLRVNVKGIKRRKPSDVYKECAAKKLKDIRSIATELSEVKHLSDDWKRVYLRLADAANELDAFIARTEIKELN